MPDDNRSSDRKAFLLRLEPATMAALRAWAADDLRSLNGQIEYVLRLALREAGRLPRTTRSGHEDAEAGQDEAAPADAALRPRPMSGSRSRLRMPTGVTE
jgi:hypothetical protein